MKQMQPVIRKIGNAPRVVVKKSFMDKLKEFGDLPLTTQVLIVGTGLSLTGIAAFLLMKRKKGGGSNGQPKLPQ